MKKITSEEYLAKIEEIKKEAEQKKQETSKLYALSNNPYNIGDIIESRGTKIKIESIKWGFSFGEKLPECVYDGPELKKDNTPKQNGHYSRIWQSTIKK